MQRKRSKRLLAGRAMAVTGMGVAAMAVAITALAQSASGWDLSFRAISGGGGKSSLLSTTVEGSIGQPFVASSSQGNFSVKSGIFEGGGATKHFRRAPMVGTDGIPTN